MTHSALFEAFQSLSAWEIRRLRQWLISPIWNQREEPLRLFDYLADCRQHAQSPTQEGAALAVFGAADVGNKLRHEMSALLEVLNAYLIDLELQDDPGRRELYLLRAFRKRGLVKNVQLSFKALEKSVATPQKAGVQQFLGNFYLQTEQYEWDLKNQRTQDFPFGSLAESLNAWYLGQLLQIACMAKSQEAIQKQADNVSAWIDRLLQLIPGQLHEQNPLVNLFYRGYQMLSTPGDAAIVEDFRRLLEQHIQLLPVSDARAQLMLAINQGIRRINQGDRSAIRTTLDFYLLGMEQKLLQDERGELSKYTYNNVLMSFLALQEWAQAEAFLEQYKAQLPEKEQENIYQYNRAICLFRQGDHEGTLEILRDVRFNDPMYNLESRKMLLKIYYEQGETDALEYQLDNLLTWLRRHGELGYHREMYRNLARFTGQLLRLAPSDRAGRERLKKKIQETPLLAERAWLLGKIGG